MNEPTGYTALDLIGYTDRGDYDPTATYVKNDLVNSGDTKWRCKVDDTIGVTPTEGVNWTAFIQLPADTTKQIIAPVEVTPSQHAYAVGKQLIFNSTLYTVTSPIAVNDALVVDTNIEVSHKTVIEQVEDNAEGIDELNDAWQKNGAYNICPNIATTQVINGVTVTVNSNKTITLNGTANAFTVINISGNILSSLDHDTTYRLVGAPANASTSSFYIYMGYQPNNASLGVDDGSGVNFSLSQTQVTYTSVACYLVIMQGTSFSNDVIKPMITTDLNATYDDYQPYAMTNKQLTERFAKVPFTVPSTTGSIVRLADYPNGFNSSNAIIINFAIDGRVGIGQFGTTYNRCFVQLASNEIQIFNGENGNVGKTGYLILGKL